MSTNIKIGVITITVLLITFSMLIIIEQTLVKNFAHENIKNSIINEKENFLKTNEFYEQEFSKKQPIFFIGSSHVGRINIMQVNNSELLKNSVEIFNLAKEADTPFKRLNELEQIISVHPDIVFYGISYREFSFPQQNEQTSILPESINKDSCNTWINTDGIVPSNPKAITFQILKKFMGEIKNYKTMPNTPFVIYPVDPIIKLDEELKKETPLTKWNDPIETKKNICAIKKIISELEKNEIKVVIFTTPLHQYYLDLLTKNQKNSFLQLQKELKQQFKITIYSFENKYKESDMWEDLTHVSTNKNVTIFNDDIIEMVTLESQK